METAKLLGMTSWVDSHRKRKSCLVNKEKKAMLDAKKKKQVDAAETPSSVASDKAEASISQKLKGARSTSAKLKGVAQINLEAGQKQQTTPADQQ